MYRTSSFAAGGPAIPSTASSSSSSHFQHLQTQKRGLTPAQQPIHRIPPFPPLLPDANTTTTSSRKHRRKEKSGAVPPNPECMTVQQAIILSQLFPEEWALLHPIYGGQGVTALSLRSLPSPESLPISPPGEEFVKLDLDACGQLDDGVMGGERKGGLPSIKDVLGEDFQWINWNQIATTVMTPPPFSPGPTHSANDDEGITLPPIRRSSSFSNDHFSNEHDNHDHHGNGAKSASNSPANHQFGTEQKSSTKTIVYYPASPPSEQQPQLLTENAHRHDGRLPPPLRALCIPPPPLDLGKINYTQPQDRDRLSPLMAISQKRYHPYQLSPVHHSPSSPAGSRTSRAVGSWTTERGITSPASADAMNTGFNMLDLQEEVRGVKDRSRLAERGGNMVVRGRRDQHALPAGHPVAPTVVVAPIRPPYTFTVLITYALVGSPQKKLTLSQLYEAISERFTYFRHPSSGNWKASVRHSLTSNDLFVKEKRGGDDPGQGGYWRLASLEHGVDATKMLLSRHGGRNALPGRCVPTPIIGGGTLQRPRGQPQPTHAHQVEQETRYYQMQQKAFIQQRLQEKQKRSAILRQEEEKQKQAIMQEQQKQASQKYKFAKPLFQDSFGKK